VINMAIKPWIQAHQRPMFIAELGINHNGSVELAKKLIDAAKAAGADVVKLQSFQAADVACRQTLSAPHIDSALGVDGDIFTLLEKLSLSYDEQRELMTYAEACGIPLMSTPFSLADIEFLQSLGVPMLKVGSTDVTHNALLQACAKTTLPLILSTGMATMDEVTAAVEAIQSVDNPGELALLHCVSLYPPADADINLRSISVLMQAYPHLVVGFSDHSLNNTAALGAIALGACIIEKHFTLDPTMAGPDQAVSAGPQAFAELVKEGTRLFNMLGILSKRPSDAEQKNIPAFRRSLVSTTAIAPGTVLTYDMLTAKRPGTGLPPNALTSVLGRQTAQAIAADTPLTEAMLMPVNDPTSQLVSAG
jgi:N,N'-diacetyllegionaminate synthase